MHWYVPSFGLFFLNLTYITYVQANKQHGVTVSTPPKADIFHMFFSSLSGPATASVAGPPATPTQGMMAPFNFMMSPWMMPPFGGYPQVPPNNHFYPPPSPLNRRSHHLHESRDHRDDIPSSDPPDDGPESPYPSITDFLRKLDLKQPQRSLSRHFNIFEEKDFYNINEVVNIAAERLSSEEFGFTAGNAHFFLDAVSKEIKRINNALKKGKSSQY